jgi:hypothetical protein
MIPLINPDLSSKTALASLSNHEIVELSNSEELYGPTNSSLKRVNPLPSPFTPEKGFTLLTAADTLLGYVYLLGKITFQPRLKQSSSHALCMSSRRLTRGAPEY